MDNLTSYAGEDLDQAATDAVFVDVFARQSDGGAIRFDHDWWIGSQAHQGNTPIVVPLGPPRTIIFNLKGTTQPNLTFKPNPRDAIWVRKGGTGCPTGPGDGTGQIDFQNSSSSPKTLTIHDLNSGLASNLHFRLRFDPDPHNYDPEIRNKGNGIVGPTERLIAAAAIGIALVALVAIFGFGKSFR